MMKVWKILGATLVAVTIVAGVVVATPLIRTGAIGLYNGVYNGITEVWVDDDFTPDTPGWGDTHFDKIQDGIDAVSGSTVHVAAGTYYENITLVDDVQVLGEGADVTIIDGGSAGSVVTAIGVGSETVLDGFTITNGNTDRGGGIYCDISSLIIRNNRIINNHAVQSDNPDDGGGGIYCGNGSNAKIVNNIIESNCANNHGGGIFFRFSSPTIENNLIVGNDGGLNVPGGQGGGIAGYGNSSATISNNRIINNTAVMLQTGVLDVGGGGIALDDGSNAIIINNTIAGNSTMHGYGGGILCDYNTSPIILNNIIVDSLDGEGIWASSVGANPTIDYNNIWNNADGNYGGTATSGLNDISQDPLFVPAVDDYHLQSNSPCIDTGTNTGAPTEDIEGNPRPIDGDGDATADTDMGAYEFVPCSVYYFFDDFSDGVDDGWEAEYGNWAVTSGEYTATGVDPAPMSSISEHDFDIFTLNASLRINSGGAAQIGLRVHDLCETGVAHIENGIVLVVFPGGNSTYWHVVTNGVGAPVNIQSLGIAVSEDEPLDIRVEVFGDTYKAYINGELKNTLIDSTYHGGKIVVGINLTYPTPVTWDSIEITCGDFDS